MRVALFVTLACCWSAATPVVAAEPQFPYPAVVQADDVYVRSGPGRKYYPTSRLGRGDQVSVHRQDPGGWLMIAPPAGSFSWIPAQYVTRTGTHQGKVNADQVVVRVGSFQSDIRDVEQRRLSNGDDVKILGQKTFQTEKGQERWFQIAPPAGEYRWIMAQYVTSLSPGQSPPPPADGPIAGTRPPSPKPGPAEVDPFADPEPVGTPQERLDGNGAIARNGPNPDQLAEQRLKLRALDDQLNQIVQQDASQWDLGGIQQSYLQLKQQTPSIAVQQQVDARLAAIDQYARLQQDYQDFVKLTSQTTQRELQLLSIQRNQVPVTTRRPEELDRPAPQPEPTQAPDPRRPSSSGSNGTAVPQPTRFEGAGLVRSVAPRFPGAPRHALMAPDGRLLAWLFTEDAARLDPYVGKTWGVNGPRVQDPRLQGEVITVRAMTPVRLAP